MFIHRGSSVYAQDSIVVRWKKSSAFAFHLTCQNYYNSA